MNTPQHPTQRATRRLSQLAGAAALALGLVTGAQAQSLVQVYESARGFDATYLSARSQFEASVAKLQAVGAKMFAEVGFGGVLANLVKRIDRSAPRAAIQDRPSFDAFVEEFGKE